MHERTEWAIEATKRMFLRRTLLEYAVVAFMGISVGFLIGYLFVRYATI